MGYNTALKLILLLFFITPLAAIIMMKCRFFRQYGLQNIGVLLGFTPFAMMIAVIYLDIEKQTGHAGRSLGVIDYASLSIAFVVCLLTVIILSGDEDEAAQSGFYAFWAVVLVIFWLIVYLISGLALLLKTHSGPLM